MDNRINFGIDLGTTNSVITKFVRGAVEVFKNPSGFKETLPSVVAFRKEKIIVGDKAKEYLEKDPKNVVGTFKRKMGTNESFPIQSLGRSLTPIELSAYVLKDLKNFIHTGEQLDAAVITIPASFDTIQSNATKEAGRQAGFDQVVLLQEPIAASLAYANKHKEQDLTNGQWIVYDLGGGTFDVALVKIKDGEMKVLDHEGDNFLGGADFDSKIVEEIIVPYLSRNHFRLDFNNDLKAASGRYNALYYELLNKAEEAKIQLSVKTSADVEFELKDNAGEEHEIFISISRDEFEGIIKDYVEITAKMIKDILSRNSLSADDIQFILMVGGSSYIPYVRKRVEDFLKISVNCNIDPTTAVAIGAAHFAGTREKSADMVQTVRENIRVSVKMAYAKATKEDEEYFSAKIAGDFSNLYYRIQREDGGFDSGLNKINAEGRISEYLPLVKNTYNYFKFIVLDEQNNIVETDATAITIAQGTYEFRGQPLPQDICLEIDDPENQTTKLELIFAKNQTLPIKKEFIKTIVNGIRKGTDDALLINVLEGPNYALPSANQIIGSLKISGTHVERDILKNSDIELIFEMSESRDLKVSANLKMTDQDFDEVFNPQQRKVSVEQLTKDMENLQRKVEQEIIDAWDRNDQTIVNNLNAKKKEVDELVSESRDLAKDDVSDAKFQLEDKKRKLAQDIDNVTKDKKISILKQTYLEEKKFWVEVLEDYAEEGEKQIFNDITKNESVFLNSPSWVQMQEKIKELVDLKYRVLWRTPEYLNMAFKQLSDPTQFFYDQDKAARLIESGEVAIHKGDYTRLRNLISELYELMPEEKREKFDRGVGIA